MPFCLFKSGHVVKKILRDMLTAVNSNARFLLKQSRLKHLEICEELVSFLKVGRKTAICCKIFQCFTLGDILV